MANSSHMKAQGIAGKDARYWVIAGADTNPVPVLASPWLPQQPWYHELALIIVLATAPPDTPT